MNKDMWFQLHNRNYVSFSLNCPIFSRSYVIQCLIPLVQQFHQVLRLATFLKLLAQLNTTLETRYRTLITLHAEYADFEMLFSLYFSCPIMHLIYNSN